LEGVKSDVIVPDSYMHIFNGEKDEENPLEWDKIDPAMYNPWINKGSLEFISANAQRRVNDNNYLKLISKRADWIEKQQKNKTIPLKFLTYQNYLDENKNITKEFESLSKYSNDLNFKLLNSEKDYIMSNKELLSNRNRWHNNLTKDIYISEGVNILKQLSLINSNSESIVSNK
jgi:carboxyl-terminal processing protease